MSKPDGLLVLLVNLLAVDIQFAHKQNVCYKNGCEDQGNR